MAQLLAMPPSKLSLLKAAYAAGDSIGALRIAAKFPQLGKEKEAITRAWAAHCHPETYRAMGQEPAQLVAAGIAAMAAKYGLEAGNA